MKLKKGWGLSNPFIERFLFYFSIRPFQMNHFILLMTNTNLEFLSYIETISNGFENMPCVKKSFDRFRLTHKSSIIIKLSSEVTHQELVYVRKHRRTELVFVLNLRCLKLGQ